LNLAAGGVPDGGPHVRDYWGFDEMVQFFASRGYAVLQVNYRGSPATDMSGSMRVAELGHGDGR
jgi:hypothetical protein